MMRWPLSLALFALLAAPVHADERSEAVAAFRGLIEQDLRLATIGYRLAAANRAFCPVTMRNPGWVVHDIAQYSDVETAKAAFGFTAPVSIAAIVPGGPAANAGLQAQDGLLAIEGGNLDNSSQQEKRASYDHLAAVKAKIAEQLRSDEAMQLTINRAGQRQDIALNPAEVCASDFQIDTAGGINAGADGKMVSISINLALFAESEIDLAAIVAHELAHNLLQHRARLDAAKVSRGLGSIIGKSKKAILATEIEADQLSIWLLHNAGYDTQAAIQFWQRYSKKHGTGIFTAGTHLRWKNRIAIMLAEVAAIAASPDNKSAINPPLLQQLRESPK